MIIAAIATAVIGYSSGPELAFSARFFSEGSKRSYYRVYTCRHDGTHRKLVSLPGAVSAFEPMWLDRNHLAFIELEGQVTNFTQVRDQLIQVQLIVFSIGDGQRRVLKTLKTSDIFTFSDPDNHLFAVGSRSFRMTPSRADIVKPGESSFKSDYEYLGGSGRDCWGVLRRGNSGKEDVKFKYPEPSGKGPERFEFEVSQKQRTSLHQVRGSRIETASWGSDGAVYVITGAFWTKFNASTWVYRIGLANRSIRPIASNVGWIDFIPTEKYWYGNQTESRPLAKLKDGRQVWVNWLYCGDWHAGKRWTIADGLVNVDRYARRPHS